MGMGTASSTGCGPRFCNSSIMSRPTIGRLSYSVVSWEFQHLVAGWDYDSHRVERCSPDDPVIGWPDITTRNLVIAVMVGGSPTIMGRSIVPAIGVECLVKPSRGPTGSSSLLIPSVQMETRTWYHKNFLCLRALGVFLHFWWSQRSLWHHCGDKRPPPGLSR